MHEGDNGMSSLSFRITAKHRQLVIALLISTSIHFSSAMAAEKITVEGGRPELEQIRIRLIDRRKFDLALAELKRIAGNNHKDAEAYFYEGLVHQRLAYACNRYEDGAKRLTHNQKALKLYERARDLGLHTAQFYYHLGEIRLNLGQTEEALADLNKSIEIDPKRGSWLWSTRAMVYMDLGNLKKAQSDMEQALKLEKSANNWLKFSMLQIKSRRLQDALKSINRAIYADPKNPDCYYIRGLIRIELNDSGSAQKDLDKVLSLDPRHAGALRLRGQAGAASGYLEQATVDIFNAKRIDRELTAKKKKSEPLSWSKAQRLLQAQEVSTRRLAQNSRDEALSYDRVFALWGLGRWKECTTEIEPLLAKKSRSRSGAMLYGACLSYLAYKNMDEVKAANAQLRRSRLSSDVGSLAADVLRYLKADISSDQLQKAALTPEDKTIAKFYIGANLRASGNVTEAYRHQDWVVRLGSRNCDEYLLAVMEKHRMDDSASTSK
jgi:tetratricopeptide (TPR) repeat protein